MELSSSGRLNEVGPSGRVLETVPATPDPMHVTFDEDPLASSASRFTYSLSSASIPSPDEGGGGGAEAGISARRPAQLTMEVGVGRGREPKFGDGDGEAEVTSFGTRNPLIVVTDPLSAAEAEETTTGARSDDHPASSPSPN